MPLTHFECTIEFKYTIPLQKKIVQSILAGIYIAIGCIGMGVVKSDTSLSPAISSILSGLVFTIGLIAVCMLNGSLFTGNCLMFTSVLNGYRGLVEFIKNLVISAVGNIIGILLICLLMRYSGFNVSVFNAISQMKVNSETVMYSVFIKAIMCNILVCMAVYSWSSFKDIMSFIMIFLSVAMFIICGFEHSIADIFFMFFAIMSPGTICSFLIVVFIGNLIGGLLYTTLIYFAIRHIPGVDQTY